MKLIDLLTRKLPENGGWPEGATEFHRHGVLEFEAYFYGEGGGQIGKSVAVPSLTCYCGDANGETVTREEYEAALAESKKIAWDGEGLPTVGCECELVNFFGNDFPEFVGEHGEEVKIIGSGFANGCPVAFYEADGGRGSMLAYAVEQCFRPIRTEAERKREDAEVAMRLCLKGTGYGMTEGAAKTVFDAIAAGKIPHITLK